MAWNLNLVIWCLLIIKPFLFYFVQIIHLRAIAQRSAVLTIISCKTRHCHRILSRLISTHRLWLSIKDALIWQNWIVTKQERVFYIRITELLDHLPSWFRNWRIWFYALTSTTFSWTCIIISPHSSVMHRCIAFTWVTLRSKWRAVLFWNERCLTLLFICDV